MGVATDWSDWAADDDPVATFATTVTETVVYYLLHDADDTGIRLLATTSAPLASTYRNWGPRPFVYFTPAVLYEDDVTSTQSVWTFTFVRHGDDTFYTADQPEVYNEGGAILYAGTELYEALGDDDAGDTRTVYQLATTPPTYSDGDITPPFEVPDGWQADELTAEDATWEYGVYSLDFVRSADEEDYEAQSVVEIIGRDGYETEYRYRNKTATPSFAARANNPSVQGDTWRTTYSATQTPNELFEWRIDRRRQWQDGLAGPWTFWGGLTKIGGFNGSSFTSRYQRTDDNSNAPAFAPSADDPSVQGSTWSTARQTPTAEQPNEWLLSRRRPWVDGVLGDWVDWYLPLSDPIATFTGTQTQTETRQGPALTYYYDWLIEERTRSRTITAGVQGAWSAWSAWVIIEIWEEQFQLNDDADDPPSYYTNNHSPGPGWSVDRQITTSTQRYEWRVTRSAAVTNGVPADTGWSDWAADDDPYSVYNAAEYQYRYAVWPHYQSEPPFLPASDDGNYPGGSTWTTARQTPTPTDPYEWEIVRTRPDSDSEWSDWWAPSDDPKSTFTGDETQERYQLSTDDDDPPDFLAAQDNPST